VTWRRFLSELMATRTGAFGLVAVTLLLIVAIFAPFLASHDPNAIAPINRLQGPSLAHFFGTDQLGRDLYSRTVYGTRIAISVAVVVLSISLTIGILLGVIAAYAPRTIDQLILSIFDIINSFPRLILALALVAVLGAGLTNLSSWSASPSFPSSAASPAPRLWPSATASISRPSRYWGPSRGASCCSMCCRISSARSSSWRA